MKKWRFVHNQLQWDFIIESISIEDAKKIAKSQLNIKKFPRFTFINEVENV